MSTGETPTVSSREADVLRGILGGKKYSDIAAEMGVGVETVRGYLKRLRDKLKIRNKVGLALWAAEHIKDQPACGP